MHCNETYQVNEPTAASAWCPSGLAELAADRIDSALAAALEVITADDPPSAPLGF